MNQNQTQSEDPRRSRPASFDPRSLDKPVVGAPMAGGPSTPALAAAVTEAGGLGFLAAGYLAAAKLAEHIEETGRLTGGPFGVNLFVPGPSAAVEAEIAAYAAELADEAAGYGISLGSPHPDDDDWAAKLEAIADLRPAVVSFTFGAPAAEILGRLSDAGVLTVVTVTTTAEAELALAHGAGALIAQGPDGGGHRGTFDPVAAPGAEDLSTLLAGVRRLTDVPVFAAGGLSTHDDVAGVLALGAAAAQVGTAFLLADEAGTNPVHRGALTDPGFTGTAVTKAFSGRYARGLRNAFMDRHDASAPFGYPEVNQLAGPLRAAAVRAGDPEGTSLWAGTGFRETIAAPAAEIVGRLFP